MKNFHDASTGELVSEALSDIKDVVELPRIVGTVCNLSGWSSCKRIPVHDPGTHAPRPLGVEGHLQRECLEKPVQGH